MKIKIEHTEEGENEIILRCQEIDDEMLKVMSVLNMCSRKLSGHKNGEIFLLEPSQVYYCESVDNSVFAYTKDNVYQILSTLNELELSFREFGYFRSSKSMIINLNMISSLKSEMGNRIDATLKNGEHIVISRRYAKLLREVLQA